MATFKVGDRVRLVRRIAPEHIQGRSYPIKHGSTATIVSIPSLDGLCDCAVMVDGVDPEPRYGSYAAMFYQLEPLIDPKADEFIERIKKLAREPAPILTPVTNRMEETK